MQQIKSSATTHILMILTNSCLDRHYTMSCNLKKYIYYSYSYSDSDSYSYCDTILLSGTIN